MTFRESPPTGATGELALVAQVRDAVKARGLGVDEARAIWSEFNAIREADPDGLVTTEAFLDRARSESSALHQLFDWDDESASEKWRRHQARQWIKALRRVTFEVLPERPADREFNVTITVRDRDDEGDAVTRRGWLPASEIRRSVDLTQQVSQTELSRIRSALSRARDAGAFDRFPQWNAIERAVSKFNAHD